LSRSAGVRGLALRPDVEADDDGVGGGGQEDVALADRARAGADHAQLDLVLGQLEDLVRHRFHRALHVGLDHERQLLELAFRDRAAEVLEADLRRRGHRLLPQLELAELDDGLRLELVGDDHELVARLRQRLQAEDLDGRGRSRFLEPLAVVVVEGADLARHRARDDGVADPQRAVLDEDGRHRPAPLSRRAFQNVPTAGFLGFGLELLQVGHRAAASRGAARGSASSWPTRSRRRWCRPTPRA
jgi:hypothetical protein